MPLRLRLRLQSLNLVRLFIGMGGHVSHCFLPEHAMVGWRIANSSSRCGSLLGEAEGSQRHGRAYLFLSGSA